jgi:predicted enzyme related to lactoylglutathione lyase
MVEGREESEMSDFHGVVWWSELMTRDVPAALKYYESVCGWSFDNMPMDTGDYHIAKKGDRPMAGIMDMTGLPGLEEVPAHWFTYLAVDDLDAAVSETTAQGGAIHRPPFAVPGVGRIAIIADPTGAAVGIMTPEEPE